MKALFLVFLLACTSRPSVPPDAAPVTIDAAAPADAPIAAIPRPPGASFACGPETCHAQQYCRRVSAKDKKGEWSTIACAAVPDPCKESPTCKCLASYGVTDTCSDAGGHAVVDVTY